MKMHQLIVTLLFIGVNFVTYGQESDILFFNQDCNFDLAGADNSCEDERYNLLNILTEQGSEIDLLQDFSQSDLQDRLEASRLLIIPELEDAPSCGISDATFLPDAAKTIIVDYVNNGGGLYIVGSSQTVAFLNDLFDLNLSASGSTNMGVSTLNEVQASGTPFESCPPTIPNLTATSLITSSMPDNKRCIYESGSSTSVAFFQVGLGTVFYIGYDYNDTGSGCSVDASTFLDCITLGGIEEAIEILPDPIPTLGEWGLIILLLLISIIGLSSLRQRNLIGCQLK